MVDAIVITFVMATPIACSIASTVICGYGCIGIYATAANVLTTALQISCWTPICKASAFSSSGRNLLPQ